MDAITLLKRDHKKVKALLNKMEKTTIRAKRIREELFKECKEELEIHTKQEEKFFYPLLKKHHLTHALAFEAFEEHSLVDDILEKIEDTDTNSEEWLARVSVLKENVEHHIREEEKVLFSKAKQVLSKKVLMEIGEKMEAFKESQKNSFFKIAV